MKDMRLIRCKNLELFTGRKPLIHIRPRAVLLWIAHKRDFLCRTIPKMHLRRRSSQW
jgi:hypothetical protein